MMTTRHADTRCQQRGISHFILDLLERFGVRESAGEGTVKLFFDKAARRQVKAYLGPVLARAVDEMLDVYAVVSGDNAVVTAGHRLERIHRR